MRPVSDRFLRVVRGSHRMCARARVVAPGQSGVNPDGVEIPIIDGDVHLDATADVRATLDLTTEPALWPADASELLTPYGNEVFVERGIIYGNGDREWVSQGYFRLYRTEQQHAPRGAVRLDGRDRMSGIVDYRLLDPIQFAQGTSVHDAVTYLAQEVYPNLAVVFDFDAGATTFAGSHIVEEDRYGFLLDIAQSLGKILYFDHEGTLRMVSPPNPAQPVFDVAAGADGVLVSLSRTLHRDGVYNAVVAAGETPGEASVRAVAWDNAPASPTYWFGAYGKVPRFYSSPFIKTGEQAKSAAIAMLRRVIGLPYSVDFTAVPNPALEPGDPVVVGSETHVLDKISIPLAAGGVMTAVTREQTTVQIGGT